MQNWIIKDVCMYLYNKYPSGKRLILTGEMYNKNNFFEISPMRPIRVNEFLLGKVNEKAIYSTFKIKKVKNEFKLLLQKKNVFYSRHYAFTMKIEITDNNSGENKKLTMRCDNVDIDEYNDDIIRVVGSCSDCKCFEK